ncbi:L-ribulokinase [Deinococcus metalli]|uniref:Ribulokinase n=1 Tax=Deinococcus metalli TaxID=1141878 RepID=A0A7W8KEN5_9DEIO|nr:ribulokinase [Deinococcus metalli]MBB5376802.1 L-ribulokinase [Deinococcus metalli]GHF45453.1 ribulokinase [Deinococcus metalli]
MVAHSHSAPYLIGLDYGTESARAVLMSAGSPDILATAVAPYRHGVIERHLRGRALPPAYALQDADDYLETAERVLTQVAARLPPGAVVAGIAVAFTSSSPLPVHEGGQPLSRRYPDEPHAYVKLWKHLTATADTEPFQTTPGIGYYGGSSSPSWLPAKAVEFAREAPDLWAQTARFVEAGDWLSAQLCGEERSEVRSVAHAGYKSHFRGAYPAEVRSALGHRLGGAPQPAGQPAGVMSEAWRQRCGLPNCPVVAVSTIDAHAAALGLGLTGSGELTAILGTSACYLISSTEELAVPGISGVVDGGIIPGLYGYEAGQAGFGDVLTWFVRAFPVAPGGTDAASFEAYNAQAAALRPGEHGLLALDWFNGCRTPLERSDLSGLLLGLTTATTRAEIYRALIEGLCYGARRVLDTFRRAGVHPGRVVLAGGLGERHPLLAGVLCDVLGQPVEVASAQSATARGAVMHAAVASGTARDFADAAAQHADSSARQLLPDAGRHAVYTDLYRAYLTLSDVLASSPVMAQVQQLAQRVRAATDSEPASDVPA